MSTTQQAKPPKETTTHQADRGEGRHAQTREEFKLASGSQSAQILTNPDMGSGLLGRSGTGNWSPAPPAARQYLERVQSYSPVKPTQSYNRARRLPHLRKLKTYLDALASAGDSDAQARSFTLCREQLSLLWDLVDSRDAPVAQMLDLIGSVLEGQMDRVVPHQVASAARTVADLLEDRFDFETRHRTRQHMIQEGVGVLPSLEETELSSIEEGDDYGEGEGE